MFGQLIGILWPQMTVADRDESGPLFAVYITAFLKADAQAEAGVLTGMGFSRTQAARIIAEAAEAGRACEGMREAAAGTLRFLERHGVLDHDPTRQALAAVGLIP